MNKNEMLAVVEEKIRDLVPELKRENIKEVETVIESFSGITLQTQRETGLITLYEPDINLEAVLKALESAGIYFRLDFALQYKYLYIHGNDDVLFSVWELLKPISEQSQECVEFLYKLFNQK